MSAEERCPAPDWDKITGHGPRLSDSEIVRQIQERDAFRAVANNLVTADNFRERFADAALSIERRLRNMICRSNVAATVKLLLVEEGMTEGEAADDKRLMRQVICYLAEIA